MADDESLVGESVTGPGKPSSWAVAAFLASCAFTSGALFLLILSLR
jgi:hypothetical protein